MAHYLCAGSTVCAHRCSARQRQAAVMALFLTGMINDGAHTANGPGETRLYQTAKKGAEGGRRQRCVGANWVQAPPATPPVFCNGSHCASVAEQGIELSVSSGKRGRGGSLI